MLKTPDWHLLIVWYFFLGGIAGGAYFTAVIADLFGDQDDKRVARTGYWIALPLVAACGGLLIADLGVPARFMNMMRVFKFWDPMSIGAWAVGVFGVFTFLSAVMSVPSSAAIDRARKAVGFVGMFFGFFLASYTGVLLSSSALPFWTDSRLMGALFLASGASTGMAAISLIMFLTGGSAGTGWGKVKRADRYSMLFELVLLAVFIGLLGAAAKPITSGQFGKLFWVGLVAFGLLIPLAIDFVGHRIKPLAAVAAVLVLAGGFVLRYVVLMSIQS